MWLLMRQCPLKHKECPLKRQLVGRVVHSLEIQVAKVTNRQQNGSAEESKRGRNYWTCWMWSHYDNLF